MQVAILSDMHVPGQADALPDEFADLVADADHVVHAGDFGSLDAIETVRGLADDLTAVYGNADPIDAPLPAVDAAEVGDVTFVVHHGEVNPIERALVHAAEGIVKQRDDWLDAVADVADARAEDPVVGRRRPQPRGRERGPRGCPRTQSGFLDRRWPCGGGDDDDRSGLRRRRRGDTPRDLREVRRRRHPR